MPRFAKVRFWRFLDFNTMKINLPMKQIWQLCKSVILNLVHKIVQNLSIWCAFICLMQQNSFFDSMQKLHFWKVPKMGLKSVLFFNRALGVTNKNSTKIGQATLQLPPNKTKLWFIPGSNLVYGSLMSILASQELIGNSTAILVVKTNWRAKSIIINGISSFRKFRKTTFFGNLSQRETRKIWHLTHYWKNVLCSAYGKTFTT